MSTSDLPFVPWESLSPAEKITALEIALRQAQQQLAEHNDDNPNYRHPFEDEPMGHLLAHGQNRNQYTGSEPTCECGLDTNPNLPRLDIVCPKHDRPTTYPLERYPNVKVEPTTPKPQQHVHERFKLIYSADMREVVFRICEDCQYADTEDYWRGWEARGVKDATA